jgi:hypothetical protein
MLLEMPSIACRNGFGNVNNKKQFLILRIMVTSEGRFQSPAIDFDHNYLSIGGNFNRPSNLYMELLAIKKAHNLFIVNKLRAFFIKI